MYMCKKCCTLSKMIVVLREGQGEEERANKPRALRFNAFKERENRKTIERRKKKTKPGHTNMVTQGHKYNKKGWHKISKAEAKKKQQHHTTNRHIQFNICTKPKSQKEADCGNKQALYSSTSHRQNPAKTKHNKLVQFSKKTQVSEARKRWKK